MSARSRPRHGSLQFYPRKRAARELHRVNWQPVYDSVKSEGILGFIAYKAGMATAILKDNTEKVMSSKKQIAVPITILEVPNMKIYSVRFYKNNQVLTEVVVSHDKELKRRLKSPKESKKLDKTPQDYDDIRIIAYSLPKQTSVKKTPDIIELGINSENKLEFVKKLIGHEISLHDFLKSDLLDVRGLTTGRGFQGPVKRFGLTLKSHKTEKGVRRPGSIGPWHPAHTSFRAPMAGQLGLFSRLTYNLKVLGSGRISEKDINPPSGFRHYGKIKTSYIYLKGSVQGPKKRQLLLTPAIRPSKNQLKRKYELLEVVM